MKKILQVLPWILSAITSAITLLIAVKENGFFEVVLHSLIVFVICKIMIYIISKILNKKYLTNIDEDDREKYMIPYFLIVLVGYIIKCYFSYKNILESILIGIVGFLMSCFIPLIINFVKGGSPSSKPSWKSNDSRIFSPDVKQGIITDEFGNIKGKSTTYDYGDYSKTYVKDNLGNVKVESTDYGNYRETKLK